MLCCPGCEKNIIPLPSTAVCSVAEDRDLKRMSHTTMNTEERIIKERNTKGQGTKQMRTTRILRKA
jgi:hypothetical protein